MLSIGEFSKICQVSTKTLRYYAKIGLILPNEINSENGYRYYSIDQLDTMLFINRLKSYNFSLDEIKTILKSNDHTNKQLYLELIKKKKEIKKEMVEVKKMLERLDDDITILKQGKSIMTYLDDIDVQLVEEPVVNLLSIRKKIFENEMATEYNKCFSALIKKIHDDKLTILSSPMVLFHNNEFGEQGLDIEFAIPIKEIVTKTRDFKPGLCLKTILHGSYSNLSSVYAKQCKWAEQNDYINNGPLYEVYVNDPLQVTDESELMTEIYYPIKKINM